MFSIDLTVICTNVFVLKEIAIFDLLRLLCYESITIDDCLANCHWSACNIACSIWTIKHDG